MTLQSFSAFAIAIVISASAVEAGPLVAYVSESGDNRIAIFALDRNDGTLTLTGALDLEGSPGSLAIDAAKSRLYAAIRSRQEFVSIPIDRSNGALGKPAAAPAGSNPAYIHIDKTGRWLLAASYSEGLATVSAIRAGLVEGPPVSVIKTGLKAHSIQCDPSNRFAFVPHVGELNKVEQLRFDAQTGMLSSNAPAAMPGDTGAGPRHFAFHPGGRWVYLVNEQGQSVTLCDLDAATGTLAIRQTVSTTPEGWDKSKGSCADIHVSADGRFVYASNRGHDSLAIFAIDPQTGMLSSRGQTPTETTPRSFCIMPGGDFVVSAGQGSHRLIVYRRDAGSGSLTPLKTYDCGKSPAWVLGVEFE